MKIVLLTHCFTRPAWLLALLSLMVGPGLWGSVVRSWNTALAEWVTSPDVSRGLMLESRAHAIVHLAMADAIDEVRQTLDFRLTDVAANAAAAEVLGALFPLLQSRVEEFASAQCGSTGHDDARRAEEIGRQVGRRWLRLRSDDGWQSAALGGMLEQRPDISEVGKAAVAREARGPESPWVGLRPMSLRSASDVKVGEPEAVGINGEIRSNHALVRSSLFKHVRRDLPVELTRRTWTGSPVLGWNRIARAMVEPAALSTAEEARIFARLNVALADAGLCAAHWRFVLGGWRSTVIDVWEQDTARQGGATVAEAVFDGFERGEARLTQRPVLLPPRPNYPLVAAALAGAASGALSNEAGLKGRGFVLEVEGVGGCELRAFADCEEAAREAAFVASLGREQDVTSAVAGFELGVAVARKTTNRVRSGSH